MKTLLIDLVCIKSDISLMRRFLIHFIALSLQVKVFHTKILH